MVYVNEIKIDPIKKISLMTSSGETGGQQLWGTEWANQNLFVKTEKVELQAVKIREGGER